MIVRGHETLLVQGITGKQGTFWTERMLEYGTKVIGGVNPQKAGTTHCGVPVFASAQAAAKATRVDAAVMFVPPLGAKEAALDAIAAGIGKLCVLTEHIPAQDVMEILAVAKAAGTRILGPNTAGQVTTGECFVGIIPAFNDNIFRKGRVGVVSRSGSLGTLICLNLVQAGYGESVFIGIGGDPVLGTTMQEALMEVDADLNSDAAILVGEIGGTAEEDAAEYASGMTKPVIAFVAGGSAPPGKKMGHAGAIVLGDRGTYRSKRRALEAAGVVVLDMPSELGAALQDKLGPPTP
ncbi:MAG: succinyl-CoA synthetase subunit alpha [Alphaproteobacteria bacterium]|nr:succinyl-CoA synthetase subunit alpha [Alphaproteobacteria bacterium]